MPLDQISVFDRKRTHKYSMIMAQQGLQVARKYSDLAHAMSLNTYDDNTTTTDFG